MGRDNGGWGEGGRADGNAGDYVIIGWQRVRSKIPSHRVDFIV